MKEKYKKYMPTCVVLFVLFLIYKYWDDATHFVGLVLHAANALFIGMVIAFIVNIPMTAIERIINKIDVFRKEVLDIVRSDSGETMVCELNVQFFPLSKEKESKSVKDGEDAK